MLMTGYFCLRDIFAQTGFSFLGPKSLWLEYVQGCWRTQQMTWYMATIDPARTLVHVRIFPFIAPRGQVDEVVKAF